MRNRTLGLVMASVAAAALLTGCANETGGSTTEIAQTPPPPAPPPPPPATVQAEQRVTMSGAMKAGDYAAAMPPPPMAMPAPEPEFRDKYEDVDPNPVKLVSEEPVSTFSIDVDTASYANVRRFAQRAQAVNSARKGASPGSTQDPPHLSPSILPARSGRTDRRQLRRHLPGEGD